MTPIQELQEYYANLLIIQYRGRPHARAMIKSFVKQMLMNQIPQKLEDSFDLEQAVGKQLDILGKRLGVTRNVYLRNGDPITLTDTDFRTFIKLQAARMTLSSALWDIQTLLIDFFLGSIRAIDNLNMTMDYFVFGESNILINVLIKQDMLPRPMGVGIRAVYDLPYKDVYGFQTYKTQSYPVVGFNTYANYNEETSWIKYSNAEFLM
jgi:hypothetical protein